MGQQAYGIQEDDPLRPRRQTSSIPETPSPILILTFNIAFDTSIFPGEQHHISLAGYYQLLCYTRARPAKLVDGERKKPKDGTMEELFGHKVIQSSFSEDGDDPMSDNDICIILSTAARPYINQIGKSRARL